MRKRETAELAMYAIIANFLTVNKAQFANYSRLNIEITTFTELHLMLAPLLAKHAATITGITADKDAAFVKLGTLIANITTKASVFASDNNNNTLAAYMDFTDSDFKYQSHTKRSTQAQGIIDAIKPFVPVMASHHIFDTHIEAINNVIITCNHLVFATRAAIAGKTTTTNAIKKLMVRLTNSLTIIGNLVASEYASSNPNLLLNYQNNRRVAGKAIRYTGLNISFTDATTGKPIEHAEISIANIKRTATSNSKGLAHIVKMTAGMYQVHCSASGYVPQVVAIKVSRGRVVKLAVGMVVEG